MPAEPMGATKIFCEPCELKGQHSFLRFYAWIWLIRQVINWFLNYSKKPGCENIRAFYSCENTAVPLTVRGMKWDTLPETVCRMAG